MHEAATQRTSLELRDLAEAIYHKLPEAPCVIVCADALKLVPYLPKGFVDLTVTDPPYESLERHRAIGTTTRLKKSKGSSSEWFNTIDNESLSTFFRELHVIHKWNTHLYCFVDSETEHALLSCGNPYGNQTAAKASNPLTDYGWTCWPTLDFVKTRRKIPKTLTQLVYDTLLNQSMSEIERVQQIMDMLTRKGTGWHWRKASERILFLEKGKRQMNFASFGNVLYGPAAEKGKTAKKPLNVIMRLIENSSSSGQLVFDPFAGYGTTGLGALILGRKALLIDRSEERCQDMIKAIRAHAPDAIGLGWTHCD